jgi:hypothetical protein
VAGAQRGNRHRAASGDSVAAYPLDRALDGRLDLDDLDAPLDLDVIGAGNDRPRISERLRRLLETTGVGPFVRRHRVPLVAGVLTAALVAGAGMQWWVSRPVPLPDAPLLLVKTSGADSTQVTVATSGDRVALSLSVAVASVERTGVVVALLGITGPGLTPLGADRSVVDTSATDSVSSVRATLDCTTPGSSAAAIASMPDDFHVLVSRTAPEGETRRDEIRLVGAQRLAQVVRATCLQAVADRELTAASVRATALDGVAASDLTVAVTSVGERAWPGLRVSTRALPWVVNGRQTVGLPAGGTVAIRARLWLQDCADPTAALRDGLLLRTTVSSQDAGPGTADDDGNTVRLRLPTTQLAQVARSFAAVCSSAVPTALVTQAVLNSGGSDTSAGTVEITLAVHGAGAALMEVDQGADTAGGRLTALDSPVHLEAGIGTLHAVWTLPRCTDLIAAGVPRFAVNLVALDQSGGERRPYLMAIGGDELRITLARLCGPAVGALIS